MRSFSSLSTILNHILRDLYTLRPKPTAVRADLAAQHSKALWAWRNEIVTFLDLDSSMLIPLFRRQKNVLNLAFWHAVIMIHRPFLLASFANLRKQNTASSPSVLNPESSVAKCLEAAMNIGTIIDELAEEKALFRGYWVGTPHILTLAALLT